MYPRKEIFIRHDMLSKKETEIIQKLFAGKEITVCLISAPANALGGFVYNKVYTALNNSLIELLGSLADAIPVTRLITNGMPGGSSVAFNAMDLLKKNLSTCKNIRNDIFLPAENILDAFPEKGFFGKTELKKHIENADGCTTIAREINASKRALGTKIAVSVTDRKMIDASDLVICIPDHFMKDEGGRKTGTVDALRYAKKNSKCIFTVYRDEHQELCGHLLPPDKKTVDAYHAETVLQITCDF